MKVSAASHTLETIPVSNHHISYSQSQCFFSKNMFRGTLSLTPGNHHFMVQIGKNKMQSMDKIYKIFRGTHTPASPQKKSTAQSQTQSNMEVIYQSTHAVIQPLSEETAATNGIQYTISL
jgi:hypothetical protein